ncbi:peptidoglycan D,D-transpeptidase FtsI family protein [Corynebacterium kroppenstedtii]|uniref:Cell division protein FtsI n=1 Tax=Corynebacterium kroppenstedtii TaxID=161879 RepID=A0A2W5SZV5_9CORY|nr:penicillin-binding protein 2 [Corynebacterium kroppenstedtii]MDU7287288.1 penicillin-binding protein 2 [Corynebacterium kroppenstedtii]PZR05156.1 MAG: cell division protein FtsI [Corynebacterium kroppenstedtii]
MSNSSSRRPRNPRTGSSPDAPLRNSMAGTSLITGAKAAMRRLNLLRAIIIALLIVLILRLVWVQLIIGPNLSSQAQEQRRVKIAEPARRGTITDTNGENLAYTMESSLLSVHPNKLRSFMEKRHEINPDSYPDPDQRMKDIADDLPRMIGDDDKADDVKSEDIEKKLTSDDDYSVLVRNVDPDKAEKIVKKYPEITAERQDVRQYPNGAIGENVLGKLSQDGSGQFGLELSQDSDLQGTNGSYTVDIAAQGMAIPGSRRDEHPAIDGDSYQLTLDNDMQTFVQQSLEQAKANSGAEDASAVVLDAKSGHILSMATTGTIDPNGDIEKQLKEGKQFGDRTISNPFEPGSVGKVITAAASIEDKKTTPDEVLQVPGSINDSGVTVKDAWDHGVTPYTTTGIFSKSSNVGTLMLAQRVGPDSFNNYLNKFGIGQATGVELPNETSGFLPPRSQWAAGTFANLPIGQGFSTSLLQMASIYQTIANDGVRIEPRIVKSIKDPDGKEVSTDAPSETRVVSAQTARTVRNMFRGVVQKDSGNQQGTGPGAAIDGYQIAGKTGTAQQVDPDTGAYSNSKYWITFAGIAPADDPRFVVAIMLNNPARGVHGEGGQSAAPLFHDIASWALNRYNVPPSKEPSDTLLLQAG